MASAKTRIGNVDLSNGIRSSLKHSSIITAKIDSHAELVSASVRGEALILARGEILKLVQDDL